MDGPILTLLYGAAGAVVLWLWYQDTQRQLRSGQEEKGTLPGAWPAGWGMVCVAIVGALVLVGLETAGEIRFDLVEEQSVLPWLALISISAAAFVEELIFRGYLVVTRRGRVWLLGSILFFSMVFAIIHPYLWSFEEGEGAWWERLSFEGSFKAWYSTGFVFLNSLWFYAVRFMPWNANRSLLPCFCAHLASNWAVFGVKLQQGFIEGLW